MKNNDSMFLLLSVYPTPIYIMLVFFLGEGQILKVKYTSALYSKLKRLINRVNSLLSNDK